jgi:hypothetical protein
MPSAKRFLFIPYLFRCYIIRALSENSFQKEKSTKYKKVKCHVSKFVKKLRDPSGVHIVITLK